ncbi:hypothetical protein IPA_00980 [Ignicoccus pacificus DSM 13166]|uniref:CBS domain-containing protein n=1 Tax=Ignicoccus pacificus DSM 13166 TaxID=940294 RepID=A0A977KAE5_9CREN|nr:hypothetical protein IPA_00980 [Ignicoccus pacificus DSM 13166]
MGWIKVVDARDPLWKAIEIMAENRIRHVPVVSANKLIGMLSVKDVLQVLEALNANELLKQEVSKFMSGRVIAASPEEPLWRALSIMAEADVGALPIVNDEDEVIGIFTERDVVRDVAPELSWEGEVERLANERPRTVEPTATILDAVSIMNELKIRHLPITERKTLKGLVSALSIMSFLKNNLKDVLKSTEILSEPVTRAQDALTYVPENTPLSEAINALGRSATDALLVVGEDMELKGIMTDRDVLRETARILEKLERP